MGTLALFGITNDGLNLAVSLLVLSLFAIWLSLIVWTYFDARRRIEDPLLVACATAASLFPFIGTIVYMIVRPPEYLLDARERHLEILAAEARLSQAEDLRCPYCDFDVERSFLRCPSCLRRLKEPCTTCSKPLDPRWKICPYCESEIGQPAAAAAQPRRTRRSGSGAQQQRQQPAAERAARAATAERAAARAASRPGEPAPADRQRPSRAANPAPAERPSRDAGPAPAERPSRAANPAPADGSARAATPAARPSRPANPPPPPVNSSPADRPASRPATARTDLPR